MRLGHIHTFVLVLLLRVSNPELCQLVTIATKPLKSITPLQHCYGLLSREWVEGGCIDQHKGDVKAGGEVEEEEEEVGSEGRSQSWVWLQGVRQTWWPLAES